MKAKWTLLFSLLMLSISSWAQEKVRYTPDFVFTDGLYLSFQDFKHNNPIPVTYIVSDLDIRDPDYLQQVLAADSVVFFDRMLNERIVAVDQLWGFCQKNRVHIGYGAPENSYNPYYFDFYPLVSIGAYSYFTAKEAYYNTLGTGLGVGVGVGLGMGMGYGNMMFDYGMPVVETQQVHLLLEFRTGKVILLKRGELGSLPPDLVIDLIKDDPELVSEYQMLSGRMKKQQGMFYIRKYNERHPIYFPK